jgi:glycosyltransferase involved in cell wall biosynthesis
VKILLITSSYLPILGGLQEAVYQLAQEFKRQGHDVSILANRYPRRLKSLEMMDGLFVKRMLFTGFYLPSFNSYVVLKYIAGLLISCVNSFRLAFLLKKTMPDVVNIHFLGSQAPYATLASRLLGVRCVISLHGDDVEGVPRRSRVDNWLFKKVLLGADYVTACSNYLLSEAKEIVPEVEGKSTAIWNGIRPEKYKNIEPYIHPRPYIFAAGRFVYKKGFDILFRAYRSLLADGERIDLILAGEGPEREKLTDLARRLGLSFAVREQDKGVAGGRRPPIEGVYFWGRAERNEMKSLMKGCKLLVVPSRKEPFGIVALEALSAGKRVVATRVGGLTEIVQDGITGYFVEAESAEDLARGIKTALSDELKDVQMDLNRFSWKEASSQYLNIFRKVKKN